MVIKKWIGGWYCNKDVKMVIESYVDVDIWMWKYWWWMKMNERGWINVSLGEY